MNTKTEPTYRVAIYMSGPLEQIKQECRRFVRRHPQCVTVKPSTFIYCGGEEEGAEIGLLNYPRFPQSEQEIYTYAECLAVALVEATHQDSALIVSPTRTEWYSKKPTRDTP